MKYLGDFTTVKINESVSIPISILKEGINDIKDYFILYKDGKVVYVINKICDHAGGRLIKKNDHAVCPMHGWILNFTDLRYNDSHVCKEKVPFEIKEEELLIFGEKENIYNSFKKVNDNSKIYFRWLNHATIYFEYNGISLITDPWLFGPSFMTGWWLSEPSPQDSIELLKKADYIYISHNHPDHLHPETLACVDKDKKIIVADFNTKSTERYLNYLGFKNIIPLNFKEIFELADGFQISILKSGDFRDDSGIYLSINNVEFLLTVDCNFLNSNILPKNIDFLMTSFAGGASGFPLCFNDYNSEEKDAIIKRNRGAMKFNVLNYIKATKPLYYMPYAGMFKEFAVRDKFINKYNLKNTVEDYQEICNQNSVKLIIPNSMNEFNISENNIKTKEINAGRLNSEDTEFYISNLKKEYQWDAQKIIEYFSNSGFSDDLIVQIIATDDNFNPLGDVVIADFKNSKFYSDNISNMISHRDNVQVSSIYVRSEIIMCVIENSLPWEDLSIGFQMRVQRTPNSYESKFWYYFTNEFIAKANYRYSSFCGACTVINQNPIWQRKVN
jgi:CMP-N-acetylneuraminate monooxygenase